MSTISGLVPANKEIWIFGDDLVTETKEWLEKLEFAYIQDETKPRLFIHENYNVRVYKNTITEAQSSNFIKEIRNDIANTILRILLESGFAM